MIFQEDAKNKDKIGEAVMEDLLKRKDQPVLHLLDLPEVDIPSTAGDALRAFRELVDRCRGLRCPRQCHDDDACIKLPMEKMLKGKMRKGKLHNKKPD